MAFSLKRRLLGDHRQAAVRFYAVTAYLIAAGSPLCASAQTPDTPEIAACKATGVLALKESQPAVRDIVLDMESISVSKANTEIEGTPVRTVIMGEVYLEKKATGKAQHFLCLIGEKGKVLLTFFAPR